MGNFAEPGFDRENEDFTAFNGSGMGTDTNAERFTALRSGGENTIRGYRSTIYKLGGVVCVSIVVKYLLIFISAYVFSLLGVDVERDTNHGYLLAMLVNDLCSYGVPAALLYYMFRYEAIPARFAQQLEFKRRMMLPLFGAAYFLAISGSFITELIAAFLLNNFGVPSPADAFAAVMPENGFQLIVFYVQLLLVAPIAEELIFRRMMLRPLRRYGDLTAILISALLFALFHGNGTQFFYTFFCGILLGFTAVWANSVIAPIILHLLINAFEVFRHQLTQLSEAGGISGLVLEIIVYTVIVLGAFSLVGMIFKGMFRLKNTCTDIPAQSKISTAVVNPLLVLGFAMLILQLFI